MTDRTLLGAIYSAFAQNLMSVQFIAMIVRWNNVQKQSMYISCFKRLGTQGSTLQTYGQTDGSTEFCRCIFDERYIREGLTGGGSYEVVILLREMIFPLLLIL